MYFQKKFEPIQYDAALAITKTKRGTSREKVYFELGLESLQDKTLVHKIMCFLQDIK